MNTPARILRASAEDTAPTRSVPSLKERDQRNTILRAGRTTMAEFGRHAIRMADFAAAIRLSPATIRRHFADMDNLLGTVLRDHLMEVIAAIGAVPRAAPDRARACRAAYLQATRTGLGAPIAAHLLLIRDRHLLPPDELSSVDDIRTNIGEIIAGEHGELTLAVLDTPYIHPSRMEAALSAILATPISLEAPAATPAPPSLRIAPFTPRIGPLSANTAQGGATDRLNPSLWERTTAPPARVSVFYGNDLTEAVRRASS